MKKVARYLILYVLGGLLGYIGDGGMIDRAGTGISTNQMLYPWVIVVSFGIRLEWGDYGASSAQG